MKTLTDLTAQTGVHVDEHLATDLEIPVSDRIQAQGDILVVPASLIKDHRFGSIDLRADSFGGLPVPARGVELLRGAHPHVLVADPGTCRYALVTDGLDLAVIEATKPVHLLHPEHGGLGIAPGRYIVRRQREQAAEQRLVAD